MKLSDDERILLEKMFDEFIEDDQTRTRNNSDELYDIATIDERIAELREEITKLEDIKQTYIESFNKRKLTIKVFRDALDSIE